MAKPRNRSDDVPSCSFCGKSQHEVRRLIAGPNAFICDECAELCSHMTDQDGSSAFPGAGPTEVQELAPETGEAGSIAREGTEAAQDTSSDAALARASNSGPIDYARLVEHSLLHVVYASLRKLSEDDARGKYQFYITYRTDWPGVVLSPDLRERYPHEMTIVLEHQYWDVIVDHEGFWVTLSFANVRHRLYLPFRSITVFTDPGVEFGLQFTQKEAEEAPIERINADLLSVSQLRFYSCFISYSCKDEEFVRRLTRDLLGRGVKCWFAPEHMRIGERIKDTLDRTIPKYDKLLLVLSHHAVDSSWVEREVERAMKQEIEPGRLVLFPIRLDDTILRRDEGWVNDVKTRQIGDFSRWRDPESYGAALERLLRDLQED